jgi:hypothetical protein
VTSRARPKTMFLMASILLAIALASTVIALSLQMYFGRIAILALLGHVLAALGAATFALWLTSNRS